MTAVEEQHDIFTGPFTGLKVVDADTHITEWHDLWTSRVPASMREKVPHVVTGDDGVQAWVFDGGDVLHRPAGASAVIKKDGTKQKYWETQAWDIQSGLTIDEVAVGAYDVKARLETMDQMGIWAQIAYPNLAGFGANRFAKMADKKLAVDIVRIYNDAAAEFQHESGDRIFPMMLVPYWDRDAAVREIERCADELHLRGITMCSEPQAGGLPDLPSDHWNPLWEVCTDKQMVINFHVGASDFGMDAFFNGAWPSNSEYRRYVVGCALLELHNARVLSNLLISDILDRWDQLKWVLVESGIGWIPYVLERLEYQLLENSPDDPALGMPSSPSQRLRDHVYNCFWFEEIGPSTALERIGFDNVLFETDYPHPTCLYPSGRPDTSAVEHGMRVLANWGPDVTRKVLSDNARKLYRLPF
jgi:predicted TIM-barrel fold metal-dependent hydrolase